MKGGGSAGPGPWPALLLVASFALSVAFVLRSPNQGATLDAGYSDSMRMAYSSHLFLRYGSDVFRVPLGELAEADRSPRAHVVWPQQPLIYPPGALLVFLPPAIAEYELDWPEASVHRATIVWLAALGHLCLFLFWRELRRQGRDLVLLIGALSWMTVVQFALNGFYDPIYMALAALGIAAMNDDRPARSLLLLGAAAFFHYRAFFFFPIAVHEAVRVARGNFRRPSRRSLAESALGVALAGLASWTFLLGAATLDDTQAINPAQDESFGAGGVIVVIGVTLAAVAYFLRGRDWQTAALLAWIAGVHSLLPFARPWHTLALYPLFLLPPARERKRELLLLWMLAFAAVGFRYFPNLRWLARGIGSLFG